MTQQVGKAAWLYRKVLRHPLLPHFIQEHGIDPDHLRVGWGVRPSGRSALKAAIKDSEKTLIMEDAFVRSMCTGDSKVVYGILADSRGIHYDLTGDSDLIHALNSCEPQGWMKRGELTGVLVRELMDRFRSVGASKYNWFKSEFDEVEDMPERGILVVDQTRGDMAIRRGGVDLNDFESMLQAAFDESEGVPVYLRAHPDHLFRSKKTCFSAKLLNDSRLRLLSPDLSPAQCFARVDTVMVVSSLMGMEALIHGKKVVTFGAPYYAGWGLTDDRSKGLLDGRKASLSLERLFEISYLRYCHYYDPDTHAPCGMGDILDHIELQKQMYSENRGVKILAGFSPWKQQIAQDYLKTPDGEIEFTADASRGESAAEKSKADIYLWGRKSQVSPDCLSRVVRVEDGFLRSKGLGAAFNYPYSWVLDRSGIYFDAAQESDLEKIYHAGFSSNELQDAAEVLDILRNKRLTKYNLACSEINLDRDASAGKKIILVPGQVEADASIQYGSPELKTNLDLLRAVRHSEPDAFIVYKVHPDLVAGTRHGELLSHDHEVVCDQVVTDGNMVDWLDACDEVHTMTSTTGFEALVRGVDVVTYGMPFYAGWGLTQDRLKCERRNRRLTVEELVCGALIKYPRYMNPDTGEFTTAVKVANLLVSDSVAADRRVWYLKLISKLKKAWVTLAR